ncbi:MAG: DUF559 domain-containing protein [Nocardioidaceae bacterium]
MRAEIDLPHELTTRPFTRAEAAEAGLSPKMLRGRRFERMFRGVYRCRGDEPSLWTWVVAALLVLPKDAVISHVTALWWYDVRVGRSFPLHFSTNSVLTCRYERIRLHRRRGRLRPLCLHGHKVTGPERTFVDCATVLPFVMLVTAGDGLIHAGRTTLLALREYAVTSHIHGVVRARLALGLVCDGVESPMETLVRLSLVFARLPRPECNAEIHREGVFVARCDLVFRAYKVIVEYDGEWHERSRRQRQRDRARLEDLEALGWTVIVVTVEDLKKKRNIVHRVHRALVAHGYTGADPHFNAMWTKWFAGEEAATDVPAAA